MFFRGRCIICESCVFYLIVRDFTSIFVRTIRLFPGTFEDVLPLLIAILIATTTVLLFLVVVRRYDTNLGQ